MPVLVQLGLVTIPPLQPRLLLLDRQDARYGPR